MSAPSITVLMPVHNAGKYLPEAIESILNQTFTDFEFLIINDGSTDDSEKIILGYNDKRIRYIKNETNLKLIATLNNGIELARGKYIARMDADDIAFHDRLQMQFDFMERNPEVALCGSAFEIIGDKNETGKYAATHNEIMMKMLFQCHFVHPSIIMRKAMIDTFEIKFDSNFLHAEDYDFFTRIGEKFKLANLQEVLLKYRYHSESISAQNKNVQNHNSGIIKKRLFKNIGVDVSEQELEIYRTIGQHEYQLTEEYLNKAQTLFENMVKANDSTNYFDKIFFRKYIAELWFHVAYNLTPLGIYIFKKYVSSFLYSSNPLSVSQRLKFQFKAFFKI